MLVVVVVLPYIDNILRPKQIDVAAAVAAVVVEHVPVLRHEDVLSETPVPKDGGDGRCHTHVEGNRHCHEDMAAAAAVVVVIGDYGKKAHTAAVAAAADHRLDAAAAQVDDGVVVAAAAVHRHEEEDNDDDDDDIVVVLLLLHNRKQQRLFDDDGPRHLGCDVATACDCIPTAPCRCCCGI